MVSTSAMKVIFLHQLMNFPWNSTLQSNTTLILPGLLRWYTPWWGIYQVFPNGDAYESFAKPFFKKIVHKLELTLEEFVVLHKSSFEPNLWMACFLLWNNIMIIFLEALLSTTSMKFLSLRETSSLFNMVLVPTSSGSLKSCLYIAWDISSKLTSLTDFSIVKWCDASSDDATSLTATQLQLVVIPLLMQFIGPKTHQHNLVL